MAQTDPTPTHGDCCQPIVEIINAVKPVDESRHSNMGFFPMVREWKGEGDATGEHIPPGVQDTLDMQWDINVIVTRIFVLNTWTTF